MITVTIDDPRLEEGVKAVQKAHDAACAEDDSDCRYGTPQAYLQAKIEQMCDSYAQTATESSTATVLKTDPLTAIDANIDNASDDDVAMLTFLYPAWSGDGVAVTVDQKLRHDGILYRVVQAHTTQADWTPDATPALFTRYREPAAAPEPWVQPTGAQDAYQTGEQVTHNGQTWVSTIDANVWEPGVTGWDVV